MGCWIPDEVKGTCRGEGPTIAGWTPSRMKMTSMLGSGLAWCFRNQVKCGGCPQTLAWQKMRRAPMKGAERDWQQSEEISYLQGTDQQIKQIINNWVSFLIVGKGC